MRPETLSSAMVYLANESLTGNVARVSVQSPRGAREGALARVSLGATHCIALLGPSGMAGLDDEEVDVRDALRIDVVLRDGMTRSFGEDGETRETLRGRGRALAMGGSLEEGLVLLRQLITQTERDAPSTMELAVDLADAAAVGIRIGADRYRDSDRLLRRALHITATVGDVATSAAWWKVLGDLYARAGWPGKNDCYAQAHASYASTLGPDHPTTRAVKALLG